MRRRTVISRLLATSALATAGSAAAASEGDFFVDASSRGSDELAVVGATRAPALPPQTAAETYTVIASIAGEASENLISATTKAEAPEAASEREPVLFEADFVTRETEDAPIVAEGNVRAYFGQRYLKADKLTYDPATDIVVAEGSVSITDKVGGVTETAFAGRVELTGDLRDGIAENFSAVLADNAKLAADTAVRERGAKTRLSKAVYTACDVCSKKGKGKTPTWRVKALRVTRDQERRVVRFHHAFLEIKGVPILYTPFVQGPDPSVERQSGFLAPFFGASSRLGFNLEVPYYLALSDHQDATFYPKYTSNDGVLWQGEYRRRDVSGSHVIQAGVINFDNTTPDSSGALPVDTPGVRWHIFAKGRREFGENWTAGYDIERVSDDTYLRRYSVYRQGDLRKEIDTTSTNRLRSNTYVRWSEGGSTLTANAYLFQGLRAQDISAKTPYILPLLDFRHDFQRDFYGGRASLNANFAAIQRAQGVDSQRLTASADWEREIITDSGHRFDLFAQARGDLYYFHDLQEGTETLAGDPTDRRNFESRLAPTVGVEWSYPLARRLGGARLYVEPRVQLAASPANRNSAAIINEDSQSIEFDYAGLFDLNKSTGYDRFEDGQRMNVGVSATAEFDNGVAIETSFGAQLRLQDTKAFDPSTGLGEKRSDFVGSLNIRLKDYLTLENRFRLDKDTGSLERAESLARFNAWRFNGAISYVRLNEENVAAELVRREELTGTMRLRMTTNWSTGFSWRQDLFANRTISQDFLIGYSDECASFDVILRRDFTQDVGLGTNNSVSIRFTLKSLVDG